MDFSQARRSKGWILLLATILGLGIGGYSFISSARENHVYVVNCGIVDYKPGAILQTCADGNIAISQIEWESWSQAGARGKAIYIVNDCNPDCASGKGLTSEVTFTLTGDNPLAVVNGKKVLNHLTIKTHDKKFLPLKSSNTETWDLS